MNIDNSFNPEIRGHFYKIKDNIGKTKGYLFSTAHVFDQKMSNLNRKMNKAIEKSDGIFFEHDRIENFMANNETTIDKIINSQSEDSIKKSVRLWLFAMENFKNDLNFKQFKNQVNKLNPTDAFKQCRKKYLEILGDALGALDSNGNYIPMLESFLHQKFVKAGKPIFGLATLEEHSQFDVRDEERLTFEILNPGSIREDCFYISSISKIWAEGKIDGKKPNEKESFEYRLLEERSKKIHRDNFQRFVK